MSWMKKCYSRLLIDNHITDIKPNFMSKFDPSEYVRLVKLSGVDSSMVYACDHNGNCYYPTMIGHQHAGTAGRDCFGETVRLLRLENIVPIAYYTVIFHNHSAINHPKWRQHDINGVDHNGRYYYSCPNSLDYVKFAKQQLTEIAVYEVEGFFIDMTFWPMICLCDNCRCKYTEETGEEIPLTIDWQDSQWIKFQRARERWMADFASGLTNHLKRIRKDVSVTHQFSPVLHGWFLGQSAEIASASDYSSGDFYGNKYQQRLGAKIFDAYSRSKPYEFMTSRCVNLNDHTSTKSEDELYLHAGTTLANGGAFLFIDAINPDGSLNERIYQKIGRVVNRLKPFTDYIRTHAPVPDADCGLYFSMNSCVNELISGTKLANLDEGSLNTDARYNAVVEEVTGTAVILNKMHIPYRAITNLNDLIGVRTLVVNNAAYMSPEECHSIRKFVECGGTLIATGMTSFYDIFGKTDGDFQLADVFGVSFSGRFAESVSYLMTDSESDMLSSTGIAAPLVNATTAEVLGNVVQPEFPADDSKLYASIHSNPPGLATEFSGITINKFGSGQCVYVYSSLLKHQQDSQQQFGHRVFKRFIHSPVVEGQNLPAGTEVTLLKSTKSRCLLCCLVNYQDELPNIPACDLKLSLRWNYGFKPCEVFLISSGQPLNYTFKDNIISFELKQLNDLEMIAIKGE